MPDSNTQMQPNSDLTQRTSQKKRMHPPRLQHSPSLPNLWLPPRFGPIPAGLAQFRKGKFHQPSTPPSLASIPLPDSTPNTPTPKLNSEQTFQSNLHDYNPTTPTKKSTSLALQPPQSLPSSKTRFRAELVNPQKQKNEKHLAERNSHLLLTPPLTPSSSLRTSTSIESTASVDVDHVHVSEEGDLAPPPSDSDEANDMVTETSTRFLRVDNVPRHASSNDLKVVLQRAFTAHNPIPTITVRHDSGLSPSYPSLYRPNDPPATVANSNINSSRPKSPDSPIKGMLVRFQESEGTIILAFFDIREAERARQYVPQIDVQMLAINTQQDERDSGKALACRFVTVAELVNMIGSSLFLDESDGGFYVAVEDKATTADQQLENDVRVSDDDRSGVDPNEIHEINEDRPEINPDILKSFLESFGPLRAFREPKEYFGSKQVFHVEFFDLRDANAASTAVHQQVVFGVRLRVFVPSVRQREYFDEQMLRDDQRAYTTSQSSVPFPSAPAVVEHEGPVGSMFKSAGEFSQTRERFFCVDGSDGVRGPDDSESPLIPAEKAPPSPTHFYTSPGSSPTHGRPNPNYAFFDSLGRPRTDRVNYPSGQPLVVSNSANVNESEEPDNRFLPEHGEPLEYPPAFYPSPGFQSPHDCYYGPPLGPSPGPSIGHSYYNACPPPSLSPPSVYYPTQPQSQYPVTSPSPVSSYEYESHPQANANAGVTGNARNWAFEHAMATAANNIGPNVNAATSPGTSVNGEYWYPGMVSPTGDPYYAPYIPHPYPHPQQGQPYSFYPIPPKHHAPLPLPPMQWDSFGNPVHPDIRQSSPPSPVHLASASGHGEIPFRTRATAATIREPAASTDRNQLNLARIEDGKDTRTTIMIKNIPNKMSDRDLVMYIDSVCPRKIDFLYLRMDFQNGCNVGYAFVNFIDVKDLLVFAKSRLGERWNMFSSEKVLQMSYANYQGKEACVEKFKNSCIMDEREAWRPKIFYSEPGPDQGLPEPFPSPTHLRRKERSSYNRGTLFPPVGSNVQGSQSTQHPPPRRLQPHGDHRSRQSHQERDRVNHPIPPRLEDTDQSPFVVKRNNTARHPRM